MSGCPVVACRRVPLKAAEQPVAGAAAGSRGLSFALPAAGSARPRPPLSGSVRERATTWQRGELQVKNIELSLGGAILNAFAYYSDIYCQKDTYSEFSR